MQKQKPTEHKELKEYMDKVKYALETKNMWLIAKALMDLEDKINAVPYYITDHSTSMTEC